MTQERERGIYAHREIILRIMNLNAKILRCDTEQSGLEVEIMCIEDARVDVTGAEAWDKSTLIRELEDVRARRDALRDEISALEAELDKLCGR